MAKMIQIRNVPDELHRKLKARASMAGMTLSDYLLEEIRRSADRPTREELLRRIAELSPLRPREAPAQAVRAERDKR